jgi:uncharacterized radical SAM protein YgiQ
LGLSVICRGELVHFSKVRGADSVSLDIETTDWPVGVCRITLYNKSGEILSSRSLFNSNSLFAPPSITVDTDSLTRRPFGYSVLGLNLVDRDGNPIRDRFCLSVRDAADYGNGSSDNLMVNLLLSSDLKGYIRNPDFYMEKDDSLHRRALDLLTLVQGWERYEWKVMTGQTDFRERYRVEEQLNVNGMGEKPVTALADAISEGRMSDMAKLPQTGFLCREIPGGLSKEDLMLASHRECLEDKRRQAANFRIIEEESNKIEARRIIQPVGEHFMVVNPPYPPMTSDELDAVYDLPYTRLPHPRYKGRRIPAYEMIRHSITIHRGCFGGCAFCTISAHQGKQIVSRSKKSILKEAEAITRMEDFKGYITDLGGPSANMYGLNGRDKNVCAKCKRPACLHPKVCPNLNTDLTPLVDLYRSVGKVPGVKKISIGSGIRYDIMQYRDPDVKADKSHRTYTEELISKHVGGRLKVAPEHTQDHVLDLMRKPPFSRFEDFKKTFDRINRECGLNQQLIPYFISSHPGCTEEDMALLAIITKRLNFRLEQVQDFTPTPMTLSTEIFYTGINPYTMKPVYSARTDREKQAQQQFFFWYDPARRNSLIAELRRIGRSDLIPKLFHP